MKNIRFSILYLGRLEFLKKHLMECDSETEMIQCLIPAVLIQHPTLGNILFDTGCTPLYNTEPSQEVRENFPVTEFISIEDALAEKGLTPSDIDTLILSHLHFDHAGGLKYFVGTNAIKNVIISEGDLKQAFFDVMTGNECAYCRQLFDVTGIQFQPISDTYDLADNLTLFVQKCHTLGVIGLKIKTENMGTVIMTGDTVYTQESYEKLIPPGGNNSKSKDDFFVNCEQLEELVQENDATLFFGHDEAQIKEWTQRGWMD